MDVVTASGERFTLGEAEASATVGIIDYSRRVTDDFGVTTVVQRGFARRLSVRLAVPTDGVDALQRRLADLAATSARWIADDHYAWLSPTGFYKDFDIDVAMPPLSYCTLSVEGLAETEAGADPGGDPAPDGRPSTLQLLQPYTVTDAILTASSVAENDAPAWAAGTGYIKGARVLRQHRVYEALVANTGADPLAGGGKWLDTGPSSRWAMFDQALGTVTQADGLITVRLETAGIAGVALLDVKGATVRVQADGYDRTQAVTGGAVTFLDLGGKGRVTVTIAGSGAVSVGTLLIGRVVALGTTEASPTAGITDFSRKTVDDFGAVTIVKRGFAKRMTAKALIRTDALDVVANRIAAVRAVPSLWIAQDGLDCLTVYGFFRDFGIEVDATVCKLSLSIEGLSAADKPAPLVNWPDLGDPDGTKPEDGATVGAPGDTPIGGVKQSDGTIQGARPAATVLADLNQNIINVANEMVVNGTWRGDTDKIIFIDGKPVRQVVEQQGVAAEGHTLFITKLQEVDSSTGLAKFMMAGNADGAIVGIQGIAGGGINQLSMVAERFLFVDTNGGNAIVAMSYDTTDKTWRLGAVEATRIKADTIVTRHLVSSSISQTRVAPVGTSVSIARNATATVATVSMTKQEPDSVMKVTFFGMFQSDDDIQMTCSVDVDGATVYPAGTINNVFDSTQSKAQSTITPFVYISDLPAGDHTFKFNVTNQEVDNIALIVKAGSAMEVLEQKRPLL